MSEKTTIHLSIAELEAAMRAGGPPTPDDVSITSDGRRLDSKQAVLDWLADLGKVRQAAPEGQEPRDSVDPNGDDVEAS